MSQPKEIIITCTSMYASSKKNLDSITFDLIEKYIFSKDKLDVLWSAQLLHDNFKIDISPERDLGAR